MGVIDRVSVELVLETSRGTNLDGLADILVNLDGVRKIAVWNTDDPNLRADRQANADRFGGVPFVEPTVEAIDLPDPQPTPEAASGETRTTEDAAGTTALPRTNATKTRKGA